MMLYVLIDTFSVMTERYQGWTSTKQSAWALLKDTTLCLCWGAYQHYTTGPHRSSNTHTH